MLYSGMTMVLALSRQQPVVPVETDKSGALLIPHGYQHRLKGSLVVQEDGALPEVRGSLIIGLPKPVAGDVLVEVVDEVIPA